MVVEPVDYFEAYNLLYIALKFAFLEHMIVPMKDLGLFLLVINSRINKLALFDLLTLLRVVGALVSILEMPRYENILLLEFLVLLLEGPDQDENFPTYFQNSRHFSNGLDSEGNSRKVMDHCYTYAGIKSRVSYWKAETIADESLIFLVLFHS